MRKSALRPALLIGLLIATACGGDDDDDAAPVVSEEPSEAAVSSEPATSAAAEPSAEETGDSGDAAVSSEPTADATESPTAAPAAVEVRGISDDKVIKIGGWAAQSGPLAVVAEIKDTAQLAFDKINAEGGVNGYTFDYVAIDDQADPSQTIVAAKELWENEEVFLVFMPYGSGANAAARDYVVENEIPVLFPFADSRIYFPDGEVPPANVFGFLPPYSDLVRHLVGEASALEDISTITVVHTNDDFGQSGSDAVEELSGELGLEVLDDIGYDATETNFAPIGRRIADAGADATLMWGIPGSPQIMTAAEESGYQGLWLAQDGFRGGFYLEQARGIPTLADRLFINAYQVPIDEGSDATADYVAAMAETYPDRDPSFGQPGWVTASMLIEAVRETTAGGAPLTWEGLRATLLSWENKDVDAARGLTYTEEFRNGATVAVVRQFDGQNFHTVSELTRLHSAP
jgi:branched-chain amino acid transport system substrate-binding protein